MTVRAFFYRHAGVGSLLATITNAAALFLTFKLSYEYLGSSIVGMWALIQGIMLISRLSDMGSAGNITRLVAIERAKHPEIRIRNLLLAGFLVNAVPILLIGVVIVGPTYYYAAANFPQVISHATLIELIISSLVFGVFSSVGTILSGCLDGLGLMALRGYISCIANVFFVAFAYIFIRTLGDLGLGIAYVAYAFSLSLLLMLGIWVFRPKVVAEHSEHSISELARKSLQFNANFLAIGVCRLLLDPICKILIGTFSTLDYVAIFDLANKVTAQARILYSSTLQAVLPLVSRDNAEIEQALRKKLLTWTWMVARWSLYTMNFIVIASGFLSLFALGRISEPFVSQTIILSLGNAVNTIGLIGYYVEVGSGHLRRLLVIYVLMAVINVVLGVVLGIFLGGLGVALAFSIALAWSGIACAQSLLGNFRQVIESSFVQIAFEIALTLSICAMAWLAMVRLDNISIVSRLAIASCAALVVAVIFVLREREQFMLLYQRRAESVAAADDGTN